jgi:hypothetical protein
MKPLLIGCIICAMYSSLAAAEKSSVCRGMERFC